MKIKKRGLRYSARLGKPFANFEDESVKVAPSLIATRVLLLAFPVAIMGRLVMGLEWLELGPWGMVFLVKLAVWVSAEPALDAGTLCIHISKRKSQVILQHKTYMMTIYAVLDVALLPLTTGVEARQKRNGNLLLLRWLVLVLKVTRIALGAWPTQVMVVAEFVVIFSLFDIVQSGHEKS